MKVLYVEVNKGLCRMLQFEKFKKALESNEILCKHDENVPALSSKMNDSYHTFVAKG